MICAASLSRSEAVWAPSIQRALSLSSISRLARGATGALPRVQMRAPTSPRTACSSASTATIGWTKNPGVLPSPPGPRPLRPAQRAKLISLVSCAHTTRRPAQARTVRMLDASMIVSTLKRGDDSRRCTATSPDRVPPMVLSTNDPVETIRSNSSTPRASTRGSPRPSSSIQKPQSSLRPLNQSDAKIETNFRASRSPQGEKGRKLKRRREILGALLIAVGIHPRIRDIKQFRHRVVADRHRIALVAAALEKIRGRHLFAQRLRHRHHVEPGAVAGEIHHLQFGGAERAHETLGACEDH